MTYTNGPGLHAKTRPTSDEMLVRLTALEAENAALHCRVAELELERAQASGVRENAAPDRGEEGLYRLLDALIDHSPSIIFIKDIEGRYLLINKRYEDECGTPREFLCGKTDHAWLPRADADRLRAQDMKIIAERMSVHYEEVLSVRNEDRTYMTIKFPLFDGKSNLLGLCGITTDITDIKRAEREREAMRDRLLAAQGEALRELSTPLMPIAKGILVMPLVGSVDEVRAARILDTLLEGITRESAHTVILDITGVRSVDGQVACTLACAARTAKLLGARVMLSGVRPDVAAKLVALGADLGGIAKVQTLATAIVSALGFSGSGAGKDGHTLRSPRALNGLGPRAGDRFR
jgi:PAS domain S-box-containing protein